VSSIQARGAAPGEPDDGGQLVAGVERDRREADHGEVRELEQRGKEPVGVGPHAVAHTIWNRVTSCSHGPCAAHSRTGSSPGKNSCSV
jgi:hypothetical protein